MKSCVFELLVCVSVSLCVCVRDDFFGLVLTFARIGVAEKAIACTHGAGDILIRLGSAS